MIEIEREKGGGVALGFLAGVGEPTEREIRFYLPFSAIKTLEDDGGGGTRKR